MSRLNEERVREHKLVKVAKRFWTFFVLGVIFIFLGVTLVAIGNNFGYHGIKRAGFICGCCGIFLDISSLLYLSLHKGRDIFPPCCFKADESDSSRQETGERDIEVEGSLRSSNFERPPSYRTCIKMKNSDSPPSYSEVILSISKTDVNNQLEVNSGESTNQNDQAINENTPSIAEHIQTTNELSNGVTESTNENAHAANEGTLSTDENSQSVSENCENGQQSADNEQSLPP